MINSIKTNFNNVAVKITRQLSNLPIIQATKSSVENIYTLIIDPNLGTNDYCVITIKINGEEHSTIKLTSTYTESIEITGNNIPIEISGYYIEQSFKRDIPQTLFYLTTQSIVSEETYCSEELYCNDIDENEGE